MKRTDDAKGQGRSEDIHYGCFRYMGIPIIFVILLILLLAVGCCQAQLISMLPDQVYYVNEDCEYYLPDYSDVITAVDNCELTYYYQYPESGQVLGAGSVTEVSVVAGDATGNEHTIKFNVLVVDTIPPVFLIDTILFNSLSHFQNQYRTWHLYNWITSQGDTLSSPEGFGFWGYYTGRDVMYIGDPKCHPPEMTFIPYDSLPDDHPLKMPADPGGEPIKMMISNVGPHDRVSYLDEPQDYRAVTFIPQITFTLNYINLPIEKIGTPGNAVIGIYEYDEPFIIGDKIMELIYETDGLSEFAQVDSAARDWRMIETSEDTLYDQQGYVLLIYMPEGTDDNELVWPLAGDTYAYGKGIYSNDAGEYWRTNDTDYLFQLYGREIKEGE